ncbi:MAG: hypothetical protein FJY80_03970 [Candidatus Aminicenantes bacterium]|nr:hypothetical protein [Candidatus Aminicenantes bacterium]
MVIDGHAHAAGEFFAAADIVRILDDEGVDKVVLAPGPVNEPKKYPVPNIGRLQGKRRLGFAGNKFLRLLARRVNREVDYGRANHQVAGMARSYPDRIVPAYWVDPADKEAMAGLEPKLEKGGFKALKVHQCFHKVASDGPEMRALARFAADKGLPVFIHLYSKKDAVALVKLITAHPGTTFVVAHLLGLDVFIHAGRPAPGNVYFDTSPPNLVPLWHVRRAVEHFGPERVLLGSDTPYGKNNLRSAVARVRGLDLPEADERLILGENARRVYRLDVSPATTRF